MKISSAQNPQIKQLIKLQEKSRERKKTGLFVVEGKRELQLAIKGNYTVSKVFYSSEFYDVDTLKQQIDTEALYFEVSTEVYKKIAYRESTEGVVAILKSKKHLLESLKFHIKNPLILVAEAPEKPGNIGALLRTADAAQVDAVIIANPKTDLYNPNIIRSSIGCVFTNTIVTGNTPDIIAFLKKEKINMYSAALVEKARFYTEKDYTKASAIIVGTEATGLSDLWLQNSESIIIPMQGKIDSMNVSVAAGILIFEAIRQRSL